MTSNRPIFTEDYIQLQWTNIALMRHLAGDVAVASVVTFGIAPLISIIDKSIVQRTAGTHSISNSMIESASSIVRSPLTFVRSPAFLLMWSVYGSTFATANCINTFQHHKQRDKNEKNSPKKSSNFQAMVMTTAVNSTTSMIKDKFYASQFNGATTNLRMPLITFGMWGLRDCTTIYSSFILPGNVGGIIRRNTDLDEETAQNLSQLICPIAAQVVATPFHILGLDCFNRPLKNLSIPAATAERIKFQCNNFSSILAARIARVAPAYCIGGVGNKYLRDNFHESFD